MQSVAHRSRASLKRDKCHTKRGFAFGVSSRTCVEKAGRLHVGATRCGSRVCFRAGTIGLLAGALMHGGKRHDAEELLQNLLPGVRYGASLGLLVYSLMCSDIEPAAKWAWKVLEQRNQRLIFNIVLLRSPSHSLIRSNESWSELAARLDIPWPKSRDRSPESVSITCQGKG